MASTDPKPLRIVIAGASGLVGGALSSALIAGGHRVVALVRRPTRPGSDEIAWHPETGQIDAARLDGCDAVIHLGGESIAGGRWTPQRKDAIRRSRIESTNVLAAALAQHRHPPRAFICASAIGYYGNRGDEPLTEDSPPGEGFLPEVCMAWEAATRPAAAAGIRVVNVRIGVVLSAAGGALAKLLPIFRAGVGGVIGNGRQYMSWIALDDLVGVIQYALQHDDLAGPINATAPAPVTNREFTKSLGRALRRPTFFPLPAFIVQAVFGEMGQRLLLDGQRVLPARLQARGYAFRFPMLEDALRCELEK